MADRARQETTSIGMMIGASTKGTPDGMNSLRKPKPCLIKP
jgi:hypothetical protein